MDFSKLLGNPVIVFVIVAAFCLIAILGQLPLPWSPENPLELAGWQRSLLGAAALLILISFIYWSIHSSLDKKKAPEARADAPRTPEWSRSFEGAQKKISSAKKAIGYEARILHADRIGRIRFVVYHGDILDARVDALASSDDNFLQAEGGVAAHILQKAGTEVEREIIRHQQRGMLDWGDVVVTTGGDIGSRFIFHPAVIDISMSRFPTPETISLVTHRILMASRGLAISSLAVPVFGGGTGAKNDPGRPWSFIQKIIDVSVRHALEANRIQDKLEFIGLYVYDPKDIHGDLKSEVQRALEIHQPSGGLQL